VKNGPHILTGFHAGSLWASLLSWLKRIYPVGLRGLLASTHLYFGPHSIHGLLTALFHWVSYYCWLNRTFPMGLTPPVASTHSANGPQDTFGLIAHVGWASSPSWLLLRALPRWASVLHWLPRTRLMGLTAQVALRTL